MPTNNTAQGASGASRPLLGTADWNEEWMRLQDMRRAADDASFWNKRSRDFDRPDTLSPYVRSFLEMAALEEGDSVLDMGCGTGSIAVPLASRGHRVLAADFSESMLAEATRRAAAAGTGSVETRLMAWEDDWDEHGVRENSVDVVLASRSLAVHDLGRALHKMCRTARKRCCASMSCGTSPRMDARVLSVCGLDNLHGRDYQYAFNILTNEGYRAECRFIYSLRKDTFDSLEDAVADFGRMVDDVAHLYPAEQIAQAHLRLREWLEDSLVSNEDAGKIDEKGYPEKALRLPEPRTIPWAFLSWEA